MRWLIVAIAIVGVVAFVELARRRLPPREQYRAVVAVGIPPAAVLGRVEAAVAALGPYSIRRVGQTITVRRRPGFEHLGDIGDNLNVTATSMDVGTKVEIEGFIEPEVIHAVRTALAQTPPWFSAS